MRPRTLLLFALVALLGGATAVPALATSKVKLEVNQNCVDPDWPCWTSEGSASRPQPSLKVTIAEGGEVEFVEHDASTPVAVNWIGSVPACTGVPTTATPANWEGSCSFTTPGTYHFESSTLFKESGPYGTNDYTKYEVVVAGPPTPTAATEPATGVTETEATLNGSVNPEGQATSYYFEYGTSTAYGEKTTELSVGNDSNNHAEHRLVTTGLAPGTPYHFRIVATYGSGKKTFGNDQTFVTASPPGPPSATTETATGIAQTEARLRGTVNPDGKPTKYFFEWGTSTSYGEKTAEAPVGEDHTLHALSAPLTTLLAGTVYHFRIVATNGSETVHGGDEMFTTSSSPPPSKETPAKEPSPSPTTPTPIPGPISPEPEIAAMGPALVQSSLKLTAPRHGSSVRGSVEVSKSGAGGRLEVELIVNSASLANVRHKKSTSTVVGRLVRSSVSAGKVSFSVSLNARAKSALRRHHKLSLTVKITLTPPSGPVDVLTRSVVLHG